MPRTLHFCVCTFVAIKKNNKKFYYYQNPTEREEINTALQSAEIQKCNRKYFLNHLMVVILIITNGPFRLCVLID